MRILFVAGLVAVAMFLIKEQQLLHRTGLLGHCTPVEAPAGDRAAWQACRAGKLAGRPDLSLRPCKSKGVHEGVEYWRCPAPVASAPVRG
jgi:hypothetical protein